MPSDAEVRSAPQRMRIGMPAQFRPERRLIQSREIQSAEAEGGRLDTAVQIW